MSCAKAPRNGEPRLPHLRRGSGVLNKREACFQEAGRARGCSESEEAGKVKRRDAQGTLSSGYLQWVKKKIFFILKILLIYWTAHKQGDQQGEAGGA